MKKLFFLLLLLFSFSTFAQSNVNTEIKNDTVILQYKIIVLFDSYDYINVSKEKIFDLDILFNYVLIYQSDNTFNYGYLYFLKPKIQCEKYLNDLLVLCKEKYPNSYLSNFLEL